MNSTGRLTRSQRIVMLLMAGAVLVPSLYGFGTKFLEFIALYRGDVDGAFAISPILNYLLASLGFLCLFGWAAMGGMFRDVELPKRMMLENEAELDRVSAWPAPRVLPHPLAGIRPPATGLSPDRNRFRKPYDHD